MCPTFNPPDLSNQTLRPWSKSYFTSLEMRWVDSNQYSTELILDILI